MKDTFFPKARPLFIVLAFLLVCLIYFRSSLSETLFVLLFYAYGSVPFALIFTYFIKGAIIYEKGTRNVGVANAFWVGGLPAGFLTVVGETSKALLPLFVSNYYFDGDLVISLVFVFSAMLGTNFSVFLKGRGGMGRTVLICTLLILAPISVLILAAIWLIVYKVSKDSYNSSMINNSLIPVILFSLEQSVPLALFGLAVAILFYLNFDKSRDEFAHYKATNKFRELFAKDRYITNVADVGDSQVGVRASRLGFLRKNGFRIPETYICTFRAYEEYFSGRNQVLDHLKKEVENLIDGNKYFAIRPSASIENAMGYYDGQFGKYLNLKGLKPIVEAIENIWAITRVKCDQEPRLAVVIQERVNPEISGVVFTRNPINGMDEVLIESVFGFKDVTSQEETTPCRWVQKWGEWIEKPEDKETVLPIIGEIAAQAKKIAKKYGKPVSLEWVFDGEEIYWLQLREIKLKNIDLYSNKISKEFLPGIIKPLIWSVNIRVVNTSWKKLFTELIGKDARNIDINNLAKPFYYRAYFNMGVVGDIFELLGMPRESVELLMGIQVAGREKPKFKPSAKTFKYIPKIILFALKKIIYEKEIEKFLTKQIGKYESFGSLNIEKLDARETLQRIDELVKANEETSYVVIITQLLMGLYNTMLKRQLEKIGVDIKRIDFEQVTQKIRDIDPNYHLLILHDKYDALPQHLKHEMRGMSYEDFSKAPEMKEFKEEVEGFLLKFGHLSDSGNDFSTLPWRETPETILKMIMSLKKAKAAKTDKVDIYALFKSPIRGTFPKFTYRKASSYREYRERISFVYSYGYGLFRSYFLQLAKLFKENGFIEKEQDIFYLKLEEIRRISELGTMPAEYKANLKKRKTEITKYKDIVLPDVIYGDSPPVPLTKNKVFSKLKGLPASKGYCEGKIKVARGIQDFNKIKDGDILVIPYSDVSWTPLFTKARAVISESGGMLSHCSIVAREYNIPAVVSVKGITELEDETLVAVNGYTGEVSIIERPKIELRS